MACVYTGSREFRQLENTYGKLTAHLLMTKYDGEPPLSFFGIDRLSFDYLTIEEEIKNNLNNQYNLGTRSYPSYEYVEQAAQKIKDETGYNFTSYGESFYNEKIGEANYRLVISQISETDVEAEKQRRLELDAFRHSEIYSDEIPYGNIDDILEEFDRITDDQVLERENACK